MHKPGSRRFGATTAGPLQLDGASLLRPSQPEHGSTRKRAGEEMEERERGDTQPWVLCYVWQTFHLTSPPDYTSGPWSHCKVIVRQQKGKKRGNKEMKTWKIGEAEGKSTTTVADCYLRFEERCLGILYLFCLCIKGFLKEISQLRMF